VHHTPISPAGIITGDGLPRTTPLRTAWDVATWLRPVPAVTVLDGLLRLGLVHQQSLRQLAFSRAGRRGARQAGRAFSLADGRAESPPESQLRVRLVLAGLPRPVPQHEIKLPGGQVYRVDLAWPQYRVAIEYDGHWHGEPEQLHADRRRLNQLVGAGWIVLHVTSKRLYQDFPGVLREIRAALRSRA
jgi:very-short-patch-repair endonuclease